jgi:hypothetical protein
MLDAHAVVEFHQSHVLRVDRSITVDVATAEGFIIGRSVIELHERYVRWTDRFIPISIPHARGWILQFLGAAEAQLVLNFVRAHVDYFVNHSRITVTIRVNTCDCRVAADVDARGVAIHGVQTEVPLMTRVYEIRILIDVVILGAAEGIRRQARRIVINATEGDRSRTGAHTNL